MFSTPLGLLALLGVPLVVALHLFRRRFWPREVSALFLWSQADPAAPAGRRREKLLRSPSFWCELIAALCLGLLLGGPRSCGQPRAEHLVVLLDSSASMSATNGEATFAEHARELVAERIDDLPAGSRVSLVASGPEPTVLAGPLALPAEADAALDDWHAALGPHALDDGLALAFELAGGEHLLLLTDHAPANELAPNVEWIALGEPLANLGFVDVARTASEARLTVQNFAHRPATAHLRVFAIDAATGRPQLELARASVAIPPGERITHSIDLTGGGAALDPSRALLRATLEPDALALDNEVVLAPPPQRTLTIGTAFNAETAVALGLTSKLESTPLDRLLGVITDAQLTDDSAAADLWLGPLAVPAPTWSLTVANPPGPRQEFVGPFLIAAGDPLVRGLTLRGLVWSTNPDIRLPGRPLVSAGDLPLVTLQGTTIALNLDPARSTLMQAPDWPILLSNIAEERRRVLRGPERTHVRLGEDLAVHADARTHFELAPRWLHGPTAASPPPTRAATTNALLLWKAPPVPGLYQLTSTRAAAADEPPAAPVTEWLAFNLLAGAESDLRALGSDVRASTAAHANTDTEPNASITWLALAALAALLLNGLFVAGRLGGA